VSVVIPASFAAFLIAPDLTARTARLAIDEKQALESYVMKEKNVKL
jgi:hypothetical protein